MTQIDGTKEGKAPPLSVRQVGLHDGTFKDIGGTCERICDESKCDHLITSRVPVLRGHVTVIAIGMMAMNRVGLCPWIQPNFAGLGSRT
jgi:hypothetical protein